VFGPADEAEYKRDYRKAMFGVTRKKAGWDCMRHYEILASGAVPLFLDIQSAPAQQPGGVMQHLPRALLEHVRNGMAAGAISVKGCEMKHTLVSVGGDEHDETRIIRWSFFSSPHTPVESIASLSNSHFA